jgi:hypothetical protein
MKKVFYPALVFALIACNPSTSPTTTSGNEDESSVKVIERNTGITPAIAYNNFFLDTASVTNYIVSKTIEGAEAVHIRNFYNARNFEYAWFAPSGATEELRNFWNAYTYDDSTAGKDKADKKLFDLVGNLLTGEDTLDIKAKDSLYANAEIGITRKFLHFVKNDEAAIDRLLPAKKYTVNEYAQIVLKEKRDTGGLTRVERQYEALKRQLKIFTDNAKRNDAIPTGGTLKKGTSSPVVAAVKRKLAPQGFISAADTSSLFTDSLVKAVKAWQQSKGLKTNGLITDSLVSRLNQAPAELIATLLVNMNRLLWIPRSLPDHYILVNIPEFVLHTYEKDKNVFDMEVVVGREGTNTMMFTGNMNNVVFSPYWNLPTSIIKKEVIPGMARNGNYIKNHNMEVTGHRGDIPIVRQLPGADNALGKVKFLFPNSYDIYLHDTNAKHLFDRDKRAYSHGCIRLQDAEKMAKYILRDDKEWTAEKINTAMNAKEEKWVRLKQTEPVLIAYFTTWVDDAGQLKVTEDIYGHDQLAKANLFSGR